MAKDIYIDIYKMYNFYCDFMSTIFLLLTFITLIKMLIYTSICIQIYPDGYTNMVPIFQIKDTPEKNSRNGVFQIHYREKRLKLRVKEMYYFTSTI